MFEKHKIIHNFKSRYYLEMPSLCVMIPMCATHGLARVCRVYIDYWSQMLINTMTVPKRGLPSGRALLQAQLFHFVSTESTP